MENSSLTITSYNYPNHYPRSLECTNFFTSIYNGSILVTFVAFETERSFDTLEIGYGSNPNDRRELLPLSGTIVPNSATFSGPDMWLRFISDDNEERSGYHIELQWVHPTKSGLNVCFFFSSIIDMEREFSLYETLFQIAIIIIIIIIIVVVVIVVDQKVIAIFVFSQALDPQN